MNILRNGADGVGDARDIFPPYSDSLLDPPDISFRGQGYALRGVWWSVREHIGAAFEQAKREVDNGKK